MRRIVPIGAAAVLAALLAACGSSSKPQADTTPPVTLSASTTTPTATTPTATAPASTPAPGPTGSQNVTIDPCALMTEQEASQLTGGRKFGPGQEETDPGGGRRCVYGAQTKNVFMVILAQASSVKEAQAVKNELLAEAQSKGISLTLTYVPNVGDDARSVYHTLTANGVHIQISAIYVLSGTVGFALVDETVEGDAPSTAALVAQAKTAIGRLP